MTALNVLIVGGTGTISSACATLAASAGVNLTVLNRGANSLHSLPQGTEVIAADVNDGGALRNALGTREFDVVANFVSYTPEQAQRDIDFFSGRVGQYIYISTTSAYQKPLLRLPIVESTPLRNPFWQYSRDKIASEDLLVKAYRDTGFPMTIVRPTHTYDRTRIPLIGGWTVIERMLTGREVIVHGDGASLWVLTHNTDFAKGFVGLFGHPQAIGDSFHITSDEVLTWNEITHIMARAADVEPRIVYATSAQIAAALPQFGPAHLGDRTHSVIFDNSKIRSLVPNFVATTPFVEGARQIMDWHGADPARRQVDHDLDDAMDRLVEASRA